MNFSVRQSGRIRLPAPLELTTFFEIPHRGPQSAADQPLTVQIGKRVVCKDMRLFRLANDLVCHPRGFLPICFMITNVHCKLILFRHPRY